jgi:hypothetical protein
MANKAIGPRLALGSYARAGGAGPGVSVLGMLLVYSDLGFAPP